MASQRPTFKPYYQNQMMAIPPTLDELVAKGHPVRIVNDVINRINIQALLDAYRIKGCSSYHPQMLLKVLVFGYVSNVYSSRKLETACRENINFMWLSGMSYPDHNTINRFRGVRLKEALRSVFEEVVKLLAEEGLLSIEDVYTDATFMRMKEDHMKNGQLKPGYNIQISTSNQYIVNYTIHPNPTDTRTLSGHLAQHEASFGKILKILTADAGYGSEENYALLAGKGIEAYVKYGMFDRDQKKSCRDKKPFSVDKLHYNPSQDCYICPMGQEMSCIGTFTQKTATGFQQQIKKYQAKNCINCPLNGACHKSKGNRIIQVNEQLEAYKDRAYELLNSDVGIAKRKQRCHDVEPVFGNIKQNHRFRRFMLRGKEKVSIEWGLLAIAQNLRKKAA